MILTLAYKLGIVLARLVGSCVIVRALAIRELLVRQVLVAIYVIQNYSKMMRA